MARNESPTGRVNTIVQAKMSEEAMAKLRADLEAAGITFGEGALADVATIDHATIEKLIIAGQRPEVRAALAELAAIDRSTPEGKRQAYEVKRRNFALMYSGGITRSLAQATSFREAYGAVHDELSHDPPDV